MLMYGKKLNLMSSYIKKENLIKLKDIIEIYINNFKAHMDTLYNHILNSKNNAYNFKDVAYLTNNASAPDKFRLKYNISTDIVTKKKLIEILDNNIKKSIRYKLFLKR
jgi:hypothetical protein